MKSNMSLLSVLVISAIHGHTCNAQNRTATKSEISGFTISLLGTGSPTPKITQFGPSILVEAGTEKLLIDCGRGAAMRLFQLKVPFADVDKVFVTHLHSDHVVGIPDMWLTGWVMGRFEKPFNVWGPAGTARMTKGLQQAFAADVGIRTNEKGEAMSRAGVELRAHKVSEGVVYKNNGLRVTVFKVDHRPFVEEAYGYRVDYDGFAAAFSGDTRPSDSLIEASKGVDVLIHECIPPQRFVRFATGRMPDERILRIIEAHTTPEQAGEIFAQVRPRVAVFSHIDNSEEGRKEMVEGAGKKFSGPTIIGEDLMQIEVGREIVVRKEGEVIFPSK